ncbi:MAG: BON domain-containing protein [Oligoflexia bacterium]|nr:BON domain-containing protein [Oligoflexia bacterium]
MQKKTVNLHVIICFIMAFFLVTTMFATLSGCSSTRTQESAGEYIDDSVITTKIKSEIASDKIVNFFQISVETYKGVVQLSGFVNTKEQAERAGQLAFRVKGVNEVKNNLIVKPK